MAVVGVVRRTLVVGVAGRTVVVVTAGPVIDLCGRVVSGWSRW